MRYVLYDKNTREILLISPKKIEPFGDSQIVTTTDIPHDYIYIDIDGTVKELPKSVQETIDALKDNKKRQRYIESLQIYVNNIKEKLSEKYLVQVDKTDILRVMSYDLQMSFEDIYITFKEYAESLINTDITLDKALDELPQHYLSYLAIAQFQYDLILQKLSMLYLDKLKTLRTKNPNDITVDDYRFEFPYTLQL